MGEAWSTIRQARGASCATEEYCSWDNERTRFCSFFFIFHLLWPGRQVTGEAFGRRMILFAISRIPGKREVDRRRKGAVSSTGPSSWTSTAGCSAFRAFLDESLTTVAQGPPFWTGSCISASFRRSQCVSLLSRYGPAGLPPPSGVPEAADHGPGAEHDSLGALPEVRKTGVRDVF